MGLPKQVEQSIKELEELEKQLQAPQTEETATDAPASEPKQPTAESVPTPPVEPVQHDVDWEQKYRTLAGKFDAEVPRLHAQVKELTGQIAYLQQQAEQQSEPVTQEQLVTDQDREAYGDDLIDLQRRVAKEVASAYESKLNSYEAKIAALEQRLMQTGNQVGEMTFEQRLLRAVPDFDQVNSDPKWIAWLDEVDPLLRAPRRAVAEQAYNQGDVDGVAHYVNLYRAATSSPKQDVRQAELSRQVAPSRVSGGTGQPVQQGKSYSMSQWTKLFDQVAMLNANGKYDDATKLEAELTSAMTQGRVTA